MATDSSATVVVDTDKGRAGPPPHAALWELATAAFPARCLHVVAALGVADALGPDGGTVDQLAGAVGVQADALGRVLRTLSSFGVFDVDDAQVHHTEQSLLLRRDHPASMGAFVHMIGLPFNWDAVGALEAAVRTGRSGLDDAHGGLWAYLDDHPDERAVFDRAMTAKSQADLGTTLDAYDVGRFATIADVGGGRGHFLDAITHRHPSARVVLVELPDVIERVRAERSAATAGGGARSDRMILHPADFFVDELPTADLYVLMDVLHDWSDDDAVRILTNVRRVAPPHATVAVVEAVMSEGPERDPSKTLDIIMLTVTGGRERTLTDFAELFRRSGFQMVAAVPTAGSMTVVEARVAR